MSSVAAPSIVPMSTESSEVRSVSAFFARAATLTLFSAICSGVQPFLRRVSHPFFAPSEVPVFIASVFWGGAAGVRALPSMSGADGVRALPSGANSAAMASAMTAARAGSSGMREGRSASNFSAASGVGSSSRALTASAALEVSFAKAAKIALSPPRGGSVLPMPELPLRSMSLMRALIRFKVFLSSSCQPVYSYQARVEKTICIAGSLMRR